MVFIISPLYRLGNNGVEKFSNLKHFQTCNLNMLHGLVETMRGFYTTGEDITFQWPWKSLVDLQTLDKELPNDLT